MKTSLFVLFCGSLLASSFAYPHEAEFIPSLAGRSPAPSYEPRNRSPVDDTAYFGPDNTLSLFNQLQNFWSQILTQRTPTFGRYPPNQNDLAPFPAPFPDFPKFFGPPDFSAFPPLPNGVDSFPTILSDLPDNYDNSTHNVKDVNGTRIETNSTVLKKTDGNSVFVIQTHIVRLTPKNETEHNTADEEVSPNVAAEEGTGEGEFGIKPYSSRPRRWINPYSFSGHSKPFLSKRKSNKKPLFNRPPTYFGDTLVNYHRDEKSLEGDAEVFNPELMRIDQLKSVNKNNKFSFNRFRQNDHLNSRRRERIRNWNSKTIFLNSDKLKYNNNLKYTTKNSNNKNSNNIHSYQWRRKNL